MNYSVIVLRNYKNPIRSIGYEPILDGLLSGGVFVDETVLLPYDDEARFTSTLVRLGDSMDGVIVVCDGSLLTYATELVSRIALVENGFAETEKTLFALVSTDKEGSERIKEVIARIDQRRNRKYDRIVLRAVLPPFELVSSAIEKAREVSGDSIDYHIEDNFGDTRIELIYDSVTPKMAADEAVRILATELSAYLYAMDDTNLPHRVADCLLLHRMHVAVAESFTAGGVGQALVSVSGASRYFYESLNTYDNGSKMERLGVNEYTLRMHGAVSEQTAYEMATGLLKTGKCDVAVSTTGIAGPKSDDTQKPVGLCYFAVGTQEQVRVFGYRLDGDRERITKTAINLALFHLYSEIK